MDDRYRVTLTAKGSEFIPYVKALRLAFPKWLGLKEAHDLAKQIDTPFILMDGVDRPTAEQAVKALQEGGAEGRIDASDYPAPMRYYRPDLDKPSGCLSTLFSSLLRGRR